MKQDVMATVRRFCAEIGSELIAAAFVYGSVAAGADTPQSDIDLFGLSSRGCSGTSDTRQTWPTRSSCSPPASAELRSRVGG
jgi:hypothetical protein